MQDFQLELTTTGSGWDSVSGLHIAGIEQMVLKFIKHAMTLNHKYIDTPDHRSHKSHIATALTLRLTNCYINVRSQHAEFSVNDKQCSYH